MKELKRKIKKLTPRQDLTLESQKDHTIEKKVYDIKRRLALMANQIRHDLKIEKCYPEHSYIKFIEQDINLFIQTIDNIETIGDSTNKNIQILLNDFDMNLLRSIVNDFNSILDKCRQKLKKREDTYEC